MFPFRDHNPSGRVPYVTYGLIVINVLIFLSHFDASQRALSQLYLDWAMIPARISANEGYYTFVSSTFLHGGWMHLIGNMLFLWIFGDNIEDELGHLKFLAFYLFTGILAGVVHYISSPLSGIPTIGASGAIAGLMGGYLVLYPKARIDILLFLLVYIKIFTIPSWVMLMVWFAMQFIGGIGADPETGGVAYWAHAGGFVVGMLTIIPTWLKLGGRGFWRQNAFHPPHPETRYSSSRIPKVRR